MRDSARIKEAAICHDCIKSLLNHLSNSSCSEKTALTDYKCVLSSFNFSKTGCLKLDSSYSYYEVAAATCVGSKNLAIILGHELLMKKRCALFVNGGKYLVFVTLVLMCSRIEFVCIEMQENLAKEKIGSSECAFAILFESDRAQAAERFPGLVLVSCESFMRDAVDTARMVSGRARAERDALVLDALRDLGLRNDRDDDYCDDGAYVCFTSGTSGTPKAIVTTRENINAYGIAKSRNEFSQSEDNTVALVSSHVFDPCVGDIVSAIFSECTIACFEREYLVNGGMAEALKISRATHVCCTPSFFEHGGMIFSDDDDDDESSEITTTTTTTKFKKEFPFLRCVSLGGERMPFSSSSSWIKSSFYNSAVIKEELVLLNVYGVTEATVYQTCSRVVAVVENNGENGEQKMSSSSLSSSSSNIGKPIDASFASLAIIREGEDEEVSLENEVGEIAIYGKGIPPIGYINTDYNNSNNSNNLKSSFRDITLKCGTKTRAYLTGDLGYFDSLNTKDFHLLGRIQSDRQIKIRGHRIELEGVENLLKRELCPDVISFICCFEENGEIVAFVKLATRNQHETATRDALLALETNASLVLSSQNAVPRKFVILSTDDETIIPLSTTGKRDYRKFYEKHRGKTRETVSSLRETKEGELNALERVVAKCWTDAISSSSPQLAQFLIKSPLDSFTSLGGSSMSALIAVRLLREALVHKPSSNEDEDEEKEEEEEREIREHLGRAFLDIEGEGPLAVCELLQFPVLSMYCNFLSREADALLFLSGADDGKQTSVCSFATAAEVYHRKMDVSRDNFIALLKNVDSENEVVSCRALSSLRDALCANARNRKLAHELLAPNVLVSKLYLFVNAKQDDVGKGKEEEGEEGEEGEENASLLNLIFAIRNAAGYGASRKLFLDELDCLRALALVVDLRKDKKNRKEDNINWQALSCMLVIARAKETKDGLKEAMELLTERGYKEVCEPIFNKSTERLSS